MVFSGSLYTCSRINMVLDIFPNHFKGFLSKRVRQEARQWRLPSGRDEPKVKRGIVEQCCHTPCSVHHLEGYCD